MTEDVNGAAVDRQHSQVIECEAIWQRGYWLGHFMKLA